MVPAVKQKGNEPKKSYGKFAAKEEDEQSSKRIQKETIKQEERQERMTRLSSSPPKNQPNSFT